MPSSTNGPRTNQFEAPTSFITSISRRRAKIESRIVFADQDRRRGEQDQDRERPKPLEDAGHAQDRVAVFLP